MREPLGRRIGRARGVQLAIDLGIAELGRDVDELDAQRGEDNAADKGVRQGRIEHVRIFGQPDAQRPRAGRQSA